MTYQPKISIVIPAYNASNYLADAIESALHQTYRNYEIIVVNDGSNDAGKTAAVAAEYADKITYIEKPNGGSSSAMNCGIRNMTGEWFSWLSHDDLYYPDKLQKEVGFLNKLAEGGTDEASIHRHILFASADLIDANGKDFKKFSRRKIKRTDEKINVPDGPLHLIAEPIQAGFHGCSCLIHKRVFEEIGMFNENLKYLNDMDLWFRLYSNGYAIHYLPSVLVMGRVHSQQLSREINFSYHGKEQDDFWQQNLEWLTVHCPSRYDLFYLYGKTAYKKTRYEDGDKAFRIAARIKPSRRSLLRLSKAAYVISSKFYIAAKATYLKLKA